jgi:ATP-dependent DNA ligase
MAPALVRPPFHREGWVYEEKVDGWRMLAYKDGARVRLISRNTVDHTARFRELAAAIGKLKPEALEDPLNDVDMVLPYRRLAQLIGR